MGLVLLPIHNRRAGLLFSVHTITPTYWFLSALVTSSTDSIRGKFV
jgi:hypothetical protein